MCVRRTFSQPITNRFGDGCYGDMIYIYTHINARLRVKILLEIHAKFFSLDRITSDDMLFILSIRFDILLSGIIIHSDDDDNDGKCRTACCYFTFL